jgi:hypothetical protein
MSKCPANEYFLWTRTVDVPRQMPLRIALVAAGVAAKRSRR